MALCVGGVVLFSKERYPSVFFCSGMVPVAFLMCVTFGKLPLKSLLLGHGLS